MTRIAFVIRDNHKVKPGGDVDLAKKFAALLAGDFEVTVVTFAELEPRLFSCVVLFNLDDPFPNYLAARKCRAANVPFVIYALHHKKGAIESFLRRGSRGLQRCLAILAGGDALNYEMLAGMLRTILDGRAGQLWRYRSSRRMTRYLLAHAACTLVSCSEEKDFIAADFGVAHFAHAVVPHQLPAVTAGYAPAPDHFILCAGRIEPRKNQLRLAALVAQHPEVRIVFVGKKNEKHTGYIQAFDQFCRQHPNLTWRQQVSLPDLLDLIRTARIYVNMSWFEVFSLIDLMALQIGTPALLSTGGYLADMPVMRANPSLTFENPADDAAIEQALTRLWQSPVEAQVHFDPSWSEQSIRATWSRVLAEVRA